MSTIEDIAHDFTALLRAGQYQTAAARYWAADIVSIEPAARRMNRGLFDASHIDDLSIDGPFVTGDQFALFMDMMIVDHISGAVRPFTEIALYTVRNARITEERYFYD